jgi:quinol monooxygenase YgiN
MSEVHAVALLRIKQGKSEEFKQFIRKLVDTVREREANRTTTYTFYSCEADPTLCLVDEVFKNAEAFVAHIKNNSEAVLSAADIFEVERSDITGDLPDDIVQSMRANSDSGESKYMHFSAVFAAL